tara:strand:- start:128 stop:349 length:222 start_codon:yes stop_codon:yes gene_type:complete
MPEVSKPSISASLVPIGKVVKVAKPFVRKIIKGYKSEKHFIDTVAKSTAGAAGVSSVTNKLTKQPNDKKQKVK